MANYLRYDFSVAMQYDHKLTDEEYKILCDTPSDEFEDACEKIIENVSLDDLMKKSDSYYENGHGYQLPDKNRGLRRYNNDYDGDKEGK